MFEYMHVVYFWFYYNTDELQWKTRYFDTTFYMTRSPNSGYMYMYNQIIGTNTD